MDNGLFGADFAIVLPKTDVKKLVQKVDTTTIEEVDTEKLLKSKKLTIHERLEVIRDRVIKVLGKQIKNTVVIRTLDDFSAYIDRAITHGSIAIDTETNNSLDPVTCKLMGPCLYVPGEKQAYIPINHVNPDTGERLSWQLTEADCKKQFQRLLDNNTDIIMHNGKFDYEVIKTTCGIELPPVWDTMIAARLLNENEQAGLKYQYVTKIDPTQEKYDIEKLFENVQYSLVDPEIFALYAARDAKMTFDLYEYQRPQFESEDLKDVYWLFKNIEMPIVIVTAEMELKGVSVNTKFGKKLKLKYKMLLDELGVRITEEVEKLKPKILAWRTEAGAEPQRIYAPKKTKKTQEELEKAYPNIDTREKIKSGTKQIRNPQLGLRFKYGKTGSQMLSDPINFASPAQLAILFYDILECPVVNKKKPRGTGKEELEALLEERPDLEIIKLLLKRRGYVKLITTYIDVIPDLVKHWPDGRIRFHLNSAGTDTGRYSSGGKLKFFENGKPVIISGLNIQNIPSRGDKSIRMLFQGDTKYHEVESIDSWFDVPETDEVEVLSLDGKPVWKFASELQVGDEVNLEEENGSGTWHIQEIQKIDKIYRIRF